MSEATFARPVRSEAHLDGRPRSPLRRFWLWLATDGPTPSSGWFAHGGLILDERGFAVVDAHGDRHPVPGTVGAIIRRDNPVQLLAVSTDDRVPAVLPNAGFSDTALQDFALTAGIRFEHESNPGWSVMVDRYPPNLRRTPDFRRCVR